jgi:putative membrane protein
MKIVCTLMGVAVLTCCFCSKDDDNSNSRPTAQDSSFMNHATYVNLGEVSAGNLAISKGTQAAIQQFGQSMIGDHTSAQEDLKKIALNVNHNLPGDTDAEHKAKAAMLMSLSGNPFDSTYIYMMVEGHDKAIQLHEAEVQQGSNKDIKRYASDKLQVIRHHRMTADSLARVLFPRS